MNTAERIELLDNEIYVRYREHYAVFGKWVKVPESREITLLWAEIEHLEGARA